MRKSSEYIGAIAAALAKAQSRAEQPGKDPQHHPIASSPRGRLDFGYAFLASGRDIVRKALSRQEIATIQTTRGHTSPPCSPISPGNDLLPAPL